MGLERIWNSPRHAGDSHYVQFHVGPDGVRNAYCLKMTLRHESTAASRPLSSATEKAGSEARCD